MALVHAIRAHHKVDGELKKVLPSDAYTKALQIGGAATVLTGFGSFFGASEI